MIVSERITTKHNNNVLRCFRFCTEVYAPWEGGTDDTDGANRCVLMEARANYAWNDVVCGTPAAYVCERRTYNVCTTECIHV